MMKPYRTYTKLQKRLEHAVKNTASELLAEELERLLTLSMEGNGIRGAVWKARFILKWTGADIDKIVDMTKDVEYL